MKKIIINSKKHGTKEVLIDADDYYKILQPYTWSVLKRDSLFHVCRAITTGKPINGKRQRKLLYLHRLILGVSDNKIFVDHKDRNGLNNTRKNLRLCTPTQNSFNISKQKGKTSKYIGVCWSNHMNRWMAYVHKDKKRHNLGVFKDEISAAKARDTASINTFGEFAHLNFPIK